MSSPVPRRESPWGMPEGDNRQPKPHRCNDRVEDVVQLPTYPVSADIIPSVSSNNIRNAHKDQACFEGNPFKTIPGPFKLFYQCMRSKPGEEPTEPFYYLQLEPPKRKALVE
ncbi:putative glutamate receptor 3.4-like isoform X1 [Capsicum annuum]|nr:putative glutamate receptor 3.4-like isoform X1 [Capsicum annuum]KAF3680829.1 putative glutamate receptor 3.4-like isoform X1 [Capsicum annuum]